MFGCASPQRTATSAVLLFGFVVALVSLGFASSARAQPGHEGHDHAQPGHEGHDHAMPAAARPPAAQPAADAAQKAAAQKAAAKEPAAQGDGAAAAHVDTQTDEGHATDDHGDGHAAFNWYYGMLGVGDEGDEPNVLFRAPGMPVPFLAMVFNTALLFGGLIWLGRKGVREGLQKRRERILQGMADAGRMRKEAHQQLAAYEQKLLRIEAEVERLKAEMQAAAEADRAKILSEAKARRERMERDAKLLVEQELKAAREALLDETMRGAVESAERLLKERVEAQDHERLEREYLTTLGSRLGRFTRGQA